MTPYSSLNYFMLLAAVLLPLTFAGARGKANGRWVIAITALMLLVQYTKPLPDVIGAVLPELIYLVLFGLYEWALLHVALKLGKTKGAWWIIALALLPFLFFRLIPMFHPDALFGFAVTNAGAEHLDPLIGFAGVSYVTFRALDVLWAALDGVLTEVGMLDYTVFLFFFPTISSGPIDRFRRFKADWRRQRNADEFWEDMGDGLHHIFRGLLYKNIIATLIDKHILGHSREATGLYGLFEYSWVYSAYLFFDFAGYSAFAVGVSRWLGVKTPENFASPWAALNIREFWNRWHISLSTWFRDHVYSRFLMLAVKRRWFKQREVTSSVGYFVSFGLMGVWHGFAWHFVIYGLYHATLMSGYDFFTRWRKKNPLRFTSPHWSWVARLLTAQAFALGLCLFSDHGIVKENPLTAKVAQVEKP